MSRRGISALHIAVLSALLTSSVPIHAGSANGCAQQFAVEESRAGRRITSKGEFNLVSVGDLINAEPINRSADNDVQRLINLLRAGDVTIANREGI